jgi:glucose/arabinose dehydrogenase
MKVPRMTAFRPLIIGAGLLALAGCGSKATIDPKTQIGANPVLPEPQAYLLPPMDVPKAIGWTGSEKPVVPAGLHIEALATGLMHPRTITVLPNGDVLIVETNGPKAPVFRPKDKIAGMVKAIGGSTAKGGNRITLVRYGADGKPTLRTIFLSGLHSPYGVVLVGSDLYVANTDAVLRFPYHEGDTQITTPGVKLTGLPGGPIDHHWTKSMVTSADGSKLYVGVGSNSNITENGMAAEIGRAAVWEIDRATGASRLYATGLRNPTNLALTPGGQLWAVVNERDELGPDLVPDYMTSVKEGAFYGWPYSYYGQHLDPRVRPQRPDLVAKAIKPDYALGSHVAALGIAWYDTAGLPAAYRGGMFVGEHGSWDRTPVSGYKVVFVPFKDGRPAGMAQDVITGFLSDGNTTHGRPVGLAVDKAGALLVADDVGNTVWRVTGAAQTAMADTRR